MGRTRGTRGTWKAGATFHGAKETLSPTVQEVEDHQWKSVAMCVCRRGGFWHLIMCVASVQQNTVAKEEDSG